MKEAKRISYSKEINFEVQMIELHDGSRKANIIAVAEWNGLAYSGMGSTMENSINHLLHSMGVRQ